MSANDYSGDRRADHTSAPSILRPASPLDHSDLVSSPATPAPAHSRIAVADMDAKEMAERAGVSPKMAITEFGEPAAKSGNQRQHRQAAPTEDAHSLASTASSADVLGREAVQGFAKDPGFKAHAGAAELHYQLQTVKDAKVVVNLDHDRDGMRDQVREQLGKLFAGHTPQSIARFATAYDGDAGKAQPVAPPASIAKEKDAYLDWLADQAASGKALQVRSRDMATTALIATALSGSRDAVQIGREGHAFRHVDLGKAADGVERELLGLNGYQNQMVGQTKQLAPAQALVARSETLDRLRSFGDRLESERSGAIDKDSTFGRFLAASRGSAAEAEIGGWNEVFYPTGKPVATLVIAGKAPVALRAVDATAELTNEVTIEIAAATPAATAPRASITAATAESAPDAAAPAPAPLVESAAELQQARTVSQRFTTPAGTAEAPAEAFPSEALPARRNDMGLPPELTHLGRVSGAEGVVPVLQMANQSRLTGRLELLGDQHAQIWFADGQIKHLRSGEASGPDALESLAMGSFRKYGFIEGDRADDSNALPQSMNHTGVILEMARIRDDKARSAVDETKRVSTEILEAHQLAEMRRGIPEA